MTRGEEIRNAIDKIIPILLSEKGRNYEQALMATGFEAGVQWADDNPKSPWISVKDDLPCNPKYLKQPDYSSWVLALTENGEVIPAQMIVMHGKWIWHSRFSGKHEDIIYWMFRPKYPPEFV